MEFELLRKSTERKDSGCQTIEIVLRKKKEGKLQPFVTHVHTLETDDYLWGNYFPSLEDANEDFEQRCREYGVEPTVCKFWSEYGTGCLRDNWRHHKECNGNGIQCDRDPYAPCLGGSRP